MNTACNSVGSGSASDGAAYKAIKLALVPSHCCLFPNEGGFYSSNYFLSTFEMAFLHPNELQRIGSSGSVQSVFEMAFLDANTERGLLKRKSDNDIGGDLRNKEMKKDIEGGMDKMRMLRVS
jgi:hypothetical protein